MRRRLTSETASRMTAMPTSAHPATKLLQISKLSPRTRTTTAIKSMAKLRDGVDDECEWAIASTCLVQG